VEKKRLNIMLPQSVIDRIDQECEIYGFSRGNMITMITKQYFAGIDGLNALQDINKLSKKKVDLNGLVEAHKD